MSIDTTMSAAGTSVLAMRSIIVTGLVRGKNESVRASQPLGAAPMFAMKNIGLAAASTQSADICPLSCDVRPIMPVHIIRHANSR